LGDFSHLSQTGEAAMVDISAKAASARVAVVTGSVQVSASCAKVLKNNEVMEICRTARIAGIQAAKQTSSLIPLCHQVALAGVSINIEFNQAEGQFGVRVEAKTTSTTGVEMEALCGASIAGATIYDMIKAVDPAATIGPFQVVEKRGGKTGLWART
jgi:cyclic pyranopterin phosphate synthase